MKIIQRSAFAVRLAKNLYPVGSKPISIEQAGDLPLSVDWWQSQPREEDIGSQRQLAALRLYLEIAKHSKVSMPAYTFPARFDFDDKTMRPDKGVIKVFLEEGIVAPQIMGSQLLFNVTSAGQDFLKSHGHPPGS